jgi:hypothetical protein
MVCTNVAPVNTPEVTVPVVTTVNARPLMFDTLLPDRVDVCPLFHVIGIVIAFAPSRLRHVAPEKVPVAFEYPEVMSGCVAETHGPYCRDTVSVSVCGEFVAGGSNRRLALLGGVHVSSIPAAPAAPEVANGTEAMVSRTTARTEATRDMTISLPEVNPQKCGPDGADIGYIAHHRTPLPQPPTHPTPTSVDQLSRLTM